MAWEIAPLRAVALRTERAVNQRWQNLRAAIMGGAVLLGVIGAAAGVSLMSGPTLPGGIGFLSASDVTSSDSELTADAARDGVAAGPTSPSTTSEPPAGGDEPVQEPDPEPAVAPPVEPPAEPARNTPTAEPQPAPAAEPIVVVPTPSPTPSAPADPADDGGLLGDLIDILLPGLLG